MKFTTLFVASSFKEMSAYVKQVYKFKSVKSQVITGNYSTVYNLYYGSIFQPDYLIIFQAGIYKFIKKIN